MAAQSRKKKDGEVVEKTQPSKAKTVSKDGAHANKPEKRKAPAQDTTVPTKKQKQAKSEKASVTTAAARHPGKGKPANKSVSTPVVKPPTGQAATQDEDVNQTSAVDSESDDVDDQTQALISAFDSSEEEDEVPGTDIAPVRDVGKIPTSAVKAKSARKSAGESSGEVGVIYVGRIPHGFFEHEMRSYFGQFGTVNKVRLSRNKRTGASKHFAFVEFADAEVAAIAAATMDRYLLFGRILRCSVVPPEQVHPDLFKGANRRFKKVPWNKLAGRRLAAPASEEQWGARVEKEEKRRALRAERMKELGYEFEGPKLKQAKAKAPAILENGQVEATEAIEGPTAVDGMSEQRGVAVEPDAAPEEPSTRGGGKKKASKGAKKAKA